LASGAIHFREIGLGAHSKLLIQDMILGSVSFLSYANNKALGDALMNRETEVTRQDSCWDCEAPQNGHPDWSEAEWRDPSQHLWLKQVYWAK